MLFEMTSSLKKPPTGASQRQGIIHNVKDLRSLAKRILRFRQAERARKRRPGVVAPRIIRNRPACKRRRDRRGWTVPILEESTLDVGASRGIRRRLALERQNYSRGVD